MIIKLCVNSNFDLLIHLEFTDLIYTINYDKQLSLLITVKSKLDEPVNNVHIIYYIDDLCAFYRCNTFVKSSEYKKYEPGVTRLANIRI